MIPASLLHTCGIKDKIQKVLNLFRLMNLRHLLVINGDKIVGIIARHDLF
jgi:CBS domain-containing protein